MLDRLDDRNRQAMQKGAAASDRRAFIGLAAGAVGGTAIAFYTHKPVWTDLMPNAPRSAATINQSSDWLRRERFRLAGRAALIGFTLSFITRGVAGAIGLMKFSQILETEGDLPVFAKTAREVVSEYEAEMRERVGQIVKDENLSRRGEPALPPTRESDQVDMVQSDGSAWSELRRTQASLSADEDDKKTKTRWDELRASNRARPSSWDRIRDAESRSRSRAAEAEADRPIDTYSDDTRADERAAAQREFDALLERERQGQADTSRWR